MIEPITHQTASSAMTTTSTARGRHQWRGSSRAAGTSIRASATNIPSSTSTQIAASAALTGEIVVWNRVSAVRESVTPASTSVNAPATSGRTSPSRVSTGRPSTETVVRVWSETTPTAQRPAGSGTVPSSTPALVTRSASPVEVTRRPDSGWAAASGRGGVVESSRSSGVRAASQSIEAVSCTGW